MKENIDIINENNEAASTEEPKNRAYEKVIKYVKDRIVSGEFQIGDRLPTERELSEKLLLSRNSVREALRTMENTGLISSRQGSGNYLTGNMQPAIEESIYLMSMLKQIGDRDICKMRRGMDILAMKLAVENYTEDMRPEIEELMRKFDMSDEMETSEAAFIDQEVHTLIAKFSNNKLLQLINESLSSIMGQFILKSRKIVILNDGDVLTSYHKLMLTSLMNKDEVGGVDAINKHYDAMEKYIDDYFFE